MKTQLQALAQQLQLGPSVQWFDPLPLQEVARVMAEADLSVVPKLTDGFGDEAFSTKILEFMALGVPVVASLTRVDAHYFNRGGVQFFSPGDPSSMAQAMLTVLSQPNLQEQLVTEGWACVDRLGWLAHEGRYLDLVDRLTSMHRVPKLHTVLAPPRTTLGDLESRP
jgi:glycosyltransferase involved in cell wall biosynthesis